MKAVLMLGPNNPADKYRNSVFPVKENFPILKKILVVPSLRYFWFHLFIGCNDLKGGC